MFSLRDECYYCSLVVLYGGLGISKLKFCIKKILNFFLAVQFFQFLVIKNLDPDWYSAKMLDPDPKSIKPDPQHWI
jgi:hypothetical protein